jgi:hypothetical protein
MASLLVRVSLCRLFDEYTLENAARDLAAAAILRKFLNERRGDGSQLGNEWLPQRRESATRD